MSARINTPISWGKVYSITRLQPLELQLQVLFYLLCQCRLCSAVPPPSSELLPLVWPLQPASSAQASTAVLHLSDWATSLESRQRERKREREYRMGGRRERSSFHRERERETDTCGGSVGSVSTLINITLYMYFLSSLKKQQQVCNISFGKKYLQKNFRAYNSGVMSGHKTAHLSSEFLHHLKKSYWMFLKIALRPTNIQIPIKSRSVRTMCNIIAST